ncbi:hypothetical protein Daesc_006171 [Daldinia eschscholtzii]|uniref:Methyltransferase n=1 Tax=Daldinia eschscholtzii TaxID=292717 RepID=A0AAX6MG14_9PEZI
MAGPSSDVNYDDNSAASFSWESTRTIAVEEDVSALSWGSGSGPSLPSVDDDTQTAEQERLGTGIWAIEFAFQNPQSFVIGTDLSPIQPEFLPENCKFEIDDAEDEWTFGEKFTYIHGRALMSCFDNPAAVVKQGFEHLEPGGFMEFQDGLFPMNYVGEPPTESALYRWNEMMLEGVTRLGRSWSNVKNYRRYFEEAGFENIVEKRFYWPTSPWAKGQYYKTVATYFQEDLLTGLEGISLKVLGVLGLSPEQVREFVEDVKKDLRSTSIHAYITVTSSYLETEFHWVLFIDKTDILPHIAPVSLVRAANQS